MSSSRRDFLKTAGMIAGVLPVARSLDAIPPTLAGDSTQTIRTRLLERRSTLETLHVDYNYESTKPNDLRNGRNHLFVSRGRFHARHEGKEGSIVQIVNDGQGLDAFVTPEGVVAHVHVWERSERRTPLRPLDSFLPQLEDKPTIARGVRQIDGTRCQGFLQGERVFWVSDTGDTVRSIEHFGTAEIIDERVIFGDFIELPQGLLFPRSIRVQGYDDKGKVIVERTITVNAVTINEPLDDQLFSVSKFPAKGARWRSNE